MQALTEYELYRQVGKEGYNFPPIQHRTKFRRVQYYISFQYLYFK